MVGCGASTLLLCRHQAKEAFAFPTNSRSKNSQTLIASVTRAAARGGGGDAQPVFGAGDAPGRASGAKSGRGAPRG